eukprot:NODE_3736_length_857_cov_62.254795_g3713_i0.p1 GENE.NODE_3736_length_857_cov_62.254795_g3713_i0~~NODE_3736_length_857_cov_62.254795_g3713_i0.p1  ORF type:complete len:179 (-),score=42.54 NODE_3736_length_857_cov_62.254795_g3713_i0:140-676(-)
MKRDAKQRQITVQWRPFLLRPNMPEDGVEKAPNTPDNPRVGARMKAAGAAVGIDFTGKTDRYPNTVLAHTLMDFAAQQGDSKQNELAEVLFRHYFTDGRYPDIANLTAAAEEVGLDKAAAVQHMETESNQQRVRREASSWSRKGVSGVPYFYVNGKDLGLSGAQPPDTLLAAIDQAQE